MSLTLTLGTAISGMLTAQRSLDVVSHNVANVNTEGYTRKVASLESRVLAGNGAGVQIAEIGRTVQEGLLRDLRREMGVLEQYSIRNDYFTRAQDLFGRTSDNSSIGHHVNNLAESFELLANQVDKPVLQRSTVQTALDLTQSLAKMTESIQALRLQADEGLGTAVAEMNTLLASIADLNDKIVFNSATNLDASDLEDKRDTAMNELAKYIDITYFKRDDGSYAIFTGQGLSLLDGKVNNLSHTAVTNIQPYMTLAAGDFLGITLNGGDVSTQILRGKLKALIELRDTDLVNMQATIDSLAKQMKEDINLVHNRGTSHPTLITEATGTRTFFLSGSQTMSYAAGDTVLALMDSSGNQSAATTVATIMTNGGFTVDAAWKISDVAAQMQSWIRSNGASTATVAVNSSGKFEIKLNSTTLSLVMRDERADIKDSRAYAQNTSALGISGTLTFRDASGALGSVNVVTTDSLTNIAATINAAALTGVTANVVQDGEGYKLRITQAQGKNFVVVDTTGLGLHGSVQDATVSFNSDASGVVDQTHSGFSNFLGLKDFFTNNREIETLDSQILASTFTAPAGGGTLQLRDSFGQIGSNITISASASLSQIASAINTAMSSDASYGSKVLSTTYTVPAGGAGNLYFGHPTAGTFGPVAVAAGQSLATIAANINALAAVGTVDISASVVSDSGGERLQISATDGATMQITNSTGLVLEKRATVEASVVPEGSGYRLRIRSDHQRELLVTQTSPATSTAIVTALNLRAAAVRTAADLTVTTLIQSGPEQIARGALQYSSDTGKYFVSEGDNQIALSLGQMMKAKRAISAAGTIPSGQFSFEEYGSAIVSQAAVLASTAKTRTETQKALKDSIQFQNDGYSGVNLDEELASLITYQNAYAASAKLISTTKEMFDILNNAVN